MSIYTPVELILDEAIRIFKEMFNEAQVAVDVSSVIEPAEMKYLMEANANAHTALLVRELIADADKQDTSKLASYIQDLKTQSMKFGAFSVASFCEKLLEAIETIQPDDVLGTDSLVDVVSKSNDKGTDTLESVTKDITKITYHSSGIYEPLVSTVPLVQPLNPVEEELLDLFNKHKNYAILSNRSGPTGVGKTFEDLLGKAEDNLSLPDFQGLIELKSRDMESSSMINLFTKSPDYLPASAASFLDYKVNSYLLRNYGYLGDKGENRLCVTLSAKETVYPKGGNYGFGLEIDDEKKFIHIVVTDRATGKEVFKDAGWTYDMLLDATKKKLQSVALVSAQKKTIDGATYYIYRHLDMIDGLDNAGLIDMIKKDIIRIDLRMKTREDGSVRDHGTGFRIRNKNLISIYKTRRLA